MSFLGAPRLRVGSERWCRSRARDTDPCEPGDSLRRQSEGAPVIMDPTRMWELLVGLPTARVIGVADLLHIEVTIATPEVLRPARSRSRPTARPTGRSAGVRPVAAGSISEPASVFVLHQMILPGPDPKATDRVRPPHLHKPRYSALEISADSGQTRLGGHHGSVWLAFFRFGLAGDGAPSGCLSWLWGVAV